MPHFASPDWPQVYGRVASMQTLPNTARETTGVTATEGVNQLTFTVKQTGFYRLFLGMKSTQQSDAATSHNVLGRCTYNDGTAIAANDVVIDGGSVGTMNLKTANNSQYQFKVIYAVVNTDIVMFVSEAVTGAKTAGVGKYNLFMSIEAF